MHINYKPPDAWTGDYIPFFWEGQYHLFYLKDFRNIPEHGEGTPWAHLVTPDLVHFNDHGECLARGAVTEQDLYVFTGSALYGEGKFHIFYTGHNPHLRQQGKPEQAIMHAVSDDLYHWQKVPEDTFFAPADRFEPHDWRDPFVFWNEEAGEYWLLAAARLKDGPSRRRGCTALCTSKDLRKWQVQEPFYAPDLFFTHECPDLFRMGDWWYLLFSEFSDSHITRYRMARSIRGPWLTPSVDSFDGRAFYAAKTASDGQKRYLFAWNPTREGCKDNGFWQWGGNLVVHELKQQPDGMLNVLIPDPVAESFPRPMPVEFNKAFRKAQKLGNGTLLLEGDGSFRCASAGVLPKTALIDLTLSFKPGTRACGLMLRTSPDFETGYYVRLEPGRNRVVFDLWPRRGDLPFMEEVERPLPLEPGSPVHLTTYVNGSICEVYVNSQVAMSTRMYDHPTGEWGVFVTDGQAEFSNFQLKTI